MSVLSRFRLPFRDDSVFGILMLIVLLVPLAFTLNLYEHYEIVKFSLLLFLLGAGLVALTVRYKAAGNFHISAGKILGTLLVLFWITTIIATVFSLDHNNSILGFYPRFTNGFLFYSVFLLFIFLGLTLSREKVIFLLKVLLFDAALISVFAILQSRGFAFYEGLDVTGVQRAPSFLGNANFATMFLAITLPITVYFLAYVTIFRQKLYYLINILCQVWAISMLSSRGAIVSILAGFVVIIIGFIFWSAKERIKILYFALTLLLVLAMSYVYIQIARPQVVQNTLQGTEVNVNLRYEVWKLSFNELKIHPFGKYGLGNYQIFFEQNRPKFLAEQSGIFDDAHNLFVQMAVTGGLQLALGFAGLCFYLFLVLVRNFIKTKEPLTMVIAGAVVSFVIAASFNPVTISCFIAFAILVISGGILTEEPKLLLLKKFKTLMFVILGTIIALLGIILFISEQLFFTGYMEYLSGSYAQSVKHLNYAISINPTNQLYYMYRAGSKIRSWESAPGIEKDIYKVKVLHPTTAYTYSRVATLYFRWAEMTNNFAYYNLSVNSLKKSLAMDPYFASRYGRLGYFLLRGRSLIEARDNFKANLTLDSKYFPSWILLAKVYQIQGLRQQMTFALEKASKLEPDLQEVQVWYRLAKGKADINTIPIPVVPDSSRLE